MVLGAADEDADRFVAVRAPKHTVDKGYVEVELARILGLELAGLEFDDDLAR